MGKALERAGRRLRRRRGTLVVKWVYCRSCRDCQGHGPYKYRVRRVDGKAVWEYRGKARPEDLAERDADETT